MPATLQDAVVCLTLCSRVQKVLRLLQTLLQKDDSGQSSSGNTAGRKSTRAERAAKRKREAQNDEDGYL
eukprot:COSAG02_NODE_1844_length_10683_cov_622.961357_3_plen_69_part_00